MQHILAIHASITGEASVSRPLVEETVARLHAASPEASVTWRDLGASPVPHLTTATVAGIVGEPTTPAERATRALSDALLAELRAADTIVIGVPMYNFSLPTGLRAWFDHLLRAGEAFRYSSAGVEGLLGGRRVIVVEARGGFYSEGPAQAIDFQEPYLRHLFAFVGITDVTFIRAEKVNFGPEARAAAIAGARAEIARVGEAALGRAA